MEEQKKDGTPVEAETPQLSAKDLLTEAEEAVRVAKDLGEPCPGCGKLHGKGEHPDSPPRGLSPAEAALANEYASTIAKLVSKTDPAGPLGPIGLVFSATLALLGEGPGVESRQDLQLILDAAWLASRHILKRHLARRGN